MTLWKKKNHGFISLSRMIPQTMKDIELKLYKKTISNKVIKFYFNKNNTMEVN